MGPGFFHCSCHCCLWQWFQPPCSFVTISNIIIIVITDAVENGVLLMKSLALWVLAFLVTSGNPSSHIHYTLSHVLLPHKFKLLNSSCVSLRKRFYIPPSQWIVIDGTFSRTVGYNHIVSYCIIRHHSAQCIPSYCIIRQGQPARNGNFMLKHPESRDRCFNLSGFCRDLHISEYELRMRDESEKIWSGLATGQATSVQVEFLPFFDHVPLSHIATPSLLCCHLVKVRFLLVHQGAPGPVWHQHHHQPSLHCLL